MARRVVERLIRLPDLTEEDRLNANLMSVLLLAVMVNALLSLVFVFHIGLFVMILVLSVLLVLGRTRYYRLSIALSLFVFTLFVLTFFSGNDATDQDVVANVLAWTAIPVLIASIVYGPLRWTALIVAVNCILLLMSPLVVSDLSLSVVLRASGLLIAVYALVLIGVSHRARLERIRQDELCRYRDHLEQMVDQRTAELEKANEDLSQLAQEKDKFVSNVSHELRTPITNIKLYHELLKRHPDTPTRYLNTLASETERLEDLVESLLLLSRFDQQRVFLTFERIDLTALIGSLVADRMPLAAQHGLTLIFKECPNPVLIQGDARLVIQVASILLTNAFNYSPQGGQVTVQVHNSHDTSPAWTGFSVCDTGPGIPPEDQPRLFERFFRGRAAQESKKPGTGLGLAIAKEIVDQHQGRIDVQSPILASGGTRVKVLFPAAD